LLGKKRTPIAAAATTEPATKKASPDAAVALPLPSDVGVSVHVHDANTASVTDTRHDRIRGLLGPLVAEHQKKMQS
jgi:hypothetical protein